MNHPDSPGTPDRRRQPLFVQILTFVFRELLLENITPGGIGPRFKSTSNPAVRIHISDGLYRMPYGSGMMRKILYDNHVLAGE